MKPEELEELEPGLYEIEYVQTNGKVVKLQAVKLGTHRYFVLWSKCETHELTETEFAEYVKSCELVYQFEQLEN